MRRAARWLLLVPVVWFALFLGIFIGGTIGTVEDALTRGETWWRVFPQVVAGLLCAWSLMISLGWFLYLGASRVDR